MSSSNMRRLRRAQQKVSILAMSKLSTLLTEFYAFLDQQPKPEDAQVRDEFIRQESRWKRYCAVHKLTDKATLLFNQEVAVQWKNKYTAQSEKIEM